MLDRAREHLKTKNSLLLTRKLLQGSPFTDLPGAMELLTPRGSIADRASRDVWPANELHVSPVIAGRGESVNGLPCKSSRVGSRTSFSFGWHFRAL